MCTFSSFLASHTCSVGDYEAAIQDYHQKGCKFMLRFYRSKRKGLSLYNADNLYHCRRGESYSVYLLPYTSSFIHPFVCPSIHLSLHSSVLPSFWLSIHLSIYQWRRKDFDWGGGHSLKLCLFFCLSILYPLDLS